MKGYTWKLVLVIGVLALSTAVLIMSAASEDNEVRLGIDLRGGAELLFEIDTSGVTEDQLPGLAEKTADIIRERIDPDDKKGLIIQAGEEGYRIYMQLPGYSREETKEIVALATNLGKLEWRLVAKDQNRIKPDDPDKVQTASGYAYFPYNASERERLRNSELPYSDGLVVEIDDEYNISGELLSLVRPTVTQTGAPAIGFTMKPEGAKRFQRMTGDNVGERIAIILNDQIYSAPVVQERITGDGIISGIRTAAEVQMLVKVLNSGSLKAPLKKESEIFVGPTLGSSTVSKALRAGILAAICVVAFMFVYYLFAGFVADAALCMNIVILMAIMIMSQATLTLPGIAGIILTVGMAVDANVLIFERVREERRLGRELPVALRLGYEKAFTAIFDSNLTTFVTAAILYYFGTGPVRGFAITLSIGIVVSFFTAVFVTRMVFELLARAGIIKDLRMLHLLTRTNIPFMRFARVFMVISLAAIVAGSVFVVKRWDANFDIDFTGGSLATLELEEPLPIEEVRKRISAAGFAEAKVQAMAGSVAESDEAETGVEAPLILSEARSFSIRTRLAEGQDLEAFEESIAGAFNDVAERRTLAVTRRRVTSVTARNDAFFGGLRYEGQLSEPINGPEAALQLSQAGIGEHKVTFYEANVETGGLDELPPDASEVTIFEVTAREASEEALAAKLAAAFTVPDPFPQDVSQIGPTVAEKMAADALVAIVLAILFIIAYIWFRFGRIRYGLAAALALLHDVLITVIALAVGDALGVFPIGQALMLGNMKISLPVVAALLTIVGYSLNDTIVVFDRIRENARLKTKSDWDIVTGSINQTLSRTILTSLTTLTVVVIMYIAGGPGIHSFAFVMMIGILAGTYSSIFIASPLLLLKEIASGKPIPQVSNK